VNRDSSPSHDLLAFRQFRFSVIRFLRLPQDISESALRATLATVSLNLLNNYKERAARAGGVGAARHRTDTQPIEIAQRGTAA
jgi:hypothetical protein